MSGNPWEDKTDAELIGYVSDPSRDARFHSAPLVEMQRRLVGAIGNFNHEASRQARVMIGLTIVIAVLTVGIFALTAVLIWKG
jgi:hypothetical protein